MAIIPTDSSVDVLADLSVVKALALIEEADATRSRSERANRTRFSRLFKDPRSIEVTITLTDEVMRIRSVHSSVRILRRTARKSSVTGFGVLNAAGLRGLAVLSRVAPAPVVGLVHRRIRRLSKDLILPAEAAPLRRHLQRRRRESIALNVNVLGEAVLGEREADERLRRVLEMIRRPEVDYVSVKLSAVVSQITTIDREGSTRRVADKMRLIYREAEAHGTFVNLDMEEYRDLELTVTAFKHVLGEAEFGAVRAGIVLQAYLPESHRVFADLVAWSQERHQRTGSSIKVRLVKGANLAMESAEAELHGWTPAPYATKADVDASYARLIDEALRPEHAQAVRIGVASHNLFHLTWALEVARARGVLDQIDVEMLEGMANAESLAIARTGQKVLLYAPVTRRDDFASAVAYLVRRLDENTSDENYLKAAFDIGSDPAKFAEQRERFTRSVRERHEVSTRSLRHAVRAPDASTFENSSNIDPTSSSVYTEIADALHDIRHVGHARIPLVIGAKEIVTVECEFGRDPSSNGEPWYDYSVADPTHVEHAVHVAGLASTSWSKLVSHERQSILLRAAAVMEGQRVQTIAVMARDAGKTVAEADPEVSEAIDFARFYATYAGALGDSRPLGTVVVVPPWNFPYAIPAGGVCAALAAGNCVILKPAPEAVATAWHLVQQLWASGVPKDVLQFVPTRDDESGRRLITHEGVDAVILTGSFDTARLFTKWRPDINLLAETSGKNSILISACADVDAAVKDLVQSAFGHAGQKCSAASLAIVVRDIYDDPAFLRQLRDAVTSLVAGPSWDLSTSVGPIIRPAEPALDRALHRLEPGESWLVEPIRLDEAALQWRPGVKLGVQPGSWSHRNEWFGPVLGVMVAPDFTTAIEWQNMTDFGLTAGIQSLDEAECERWMDEVQAGNLYVNRGVTGAVVKRQPFGGWRRSSVGPTAKAGGPNYVAALRAWPELYDLAPAIDGAATWWREVGSRAIDPSGLRVERNYQRYRRPVKGLVVRVDDRCTPGEISLIGFIRETAGLRVTFSSETSNPLIADVTTESVGDLVARSGEVARVRWLSHERAPAAELLERGVSVDRRPLSQRGDVEMARWLLEQSVAITYHRYGNVNGGPKPRCEGLG